MLLFDMLLGITALVVIMSGTLALIAGLRQQRQVNREYFLATQYLANVLEEIDAADLSVVDLTKFEHDTLGNDVLRNLPGVRLKVEIDPSTLKEDTEISKTLGLHQISCSLTWPSRHARPPYRISLTMWKSLLAPSDDSAAREEAIP
jgi:hypothetical protein